MKELLKRRLTFLLALSLCLSMLQMSGTVVYAEENEETEFQVDDIALLAETEAAPAVTEEIMQEKNAALPETVEEDGSWEEEAVSGVNPEQTEVNETEPSEEAVQEREEVSSAENTDVTEAVPAGWMEEEISGSLQGGENTVFVSAGETVYYSFVPQNSGKYVIQSDVNMDTVGYLYDENDQQLTYDDDGGTRSNFLMRWSLQAGKTYYIGIRFYNHSYEGDVRILIQEAEKPFFYDEVAGSLNMGSNRVHLTDSESYYSFTAEKGGFHTFYTASGKNMYGLLYDDTGSLLTEANGGLAGVDFEIEYNLTAGETYYIAGYLMDEQDADVELIIRRGTLYSYYYELTEEFYLEYQVTDDGIRIIDSDGNAPVKIEVPAEIEGKPVVEIHNMGYSWDTEELCLPDSVKRIDDYAASRLYALKKVNIPSSLEELGVRQPFADSELEHITGRSSNGKYFAEDDVLYGNYGQTLLLSGKRVTAVQIPDGVVEIPEKAFRYRYDLESISFPASLRRIGSAAFSGCGRLGRIVLPEGLEEIGDHAFQGCRKLRFDSLPNNIRVIEEGAFLNCSSVSSINVPGNLEVLGMRAFPVCSYTGRSNSGEFFAQNNILYGSFGSEILAAGQLGDSVTIPEGIESLPESLFYGSMVREVILPESLKEIGEYAFAECRTLEKINIPDGVTSIGYGAFAYDKALKSIHIPSALQSLENSVFLSCDALSTITGGSADGHYLVAGNILYEITEDESDILLVGKGVENVVIPEGITVIPSQTFKGCTGLTSVQLPESLTEIRYGAFGDCVSLREIVIPDSVENMESAVFAGCTSLERVVLPDGLTEIPIEMFRDCTSLKQVLIPDSVRFIEGVAFENCLSLTEIHLPASLERLNSTAFDGCTNLVSFTGGPSDGSVALKDGILYTDQGKTVCFATKNLKQAVLEEGVESISDYAFRNCVSLRTISLPQSLTSFGIGVFGGCSSLAEIEIPAGTYFVNYSMFAGCSSLKKVILPEGLKGIRRGAFNGCSSLESIVLPEGLVSIEQMAFRESGLKSIHLPATLSELSESAFEDCDSLEEITGAASDGAFVTDENCLYVGDTLAFVPRNKSEIHFRSGVKAIGYGAFENNRNLNAIILPDTVEAISPNAFKNCRNLERVQLPASLNTISLNMFTGCEKLGAITGQSSSGEYITKDGIMYSEYGKVLFCYPEGKAAESFAVGKDVTTVAYRAFYHCTCLKKIYFEGDAPEIIYRAFEGSPLTAYYPENNASWEPVLLDGDYLGDMTWVAYDPDGMTPAKPVLSAVSNLSAGVKLTWEKAENAEGYHIFRTVYGKNSYEQVGTVSGGSVLTFTDTGAVSGTTYTYRIQAYAANKVSANSNTKSYRFLSMPKIAETENLASGIVLKWEKVTGAAGYYVYRRSSSSESWVEIADLSGGSTVTYTDAAVVNGKTYYYALRAYHKTSSGTIYQSSRSSSGTKVVREYTLVLDKPVISAISNLSTGVKLTWAKVENAEGYEIYRTVYGKNSYSKVGSVSSGSTVTFTDTTAQNKTTYTYKIKAYAGDVTSAYSTTKTYRFITMPTNFKAENLASGIKVTWDEVPGASGYYVYRRTSSGGEWTLAKTVTEGTTVSYTNTAVKENYGSSYYYTVRAYYTTSSGNIYESSRSTSGIKMVRVRTAGTPTLSNTAGGIKVTWTKTEGASGYYVYRKAENETEYKLMKTVTSPDTLTYTNTSVKNGISYSYKVAAYVTSSGKDYAGAAGSAKTTVRLDQPSVASVTSSTAGKMTVSWSQNTAATSYQVEYAANSSFTNAVRKTYSTTKTSQTISGITGGSYYVRVRSYYKNEAGTSYYSAWSAAQSAVVK